MSDRLPGRWSAMLVAAFFAAALAMLLANAMVLDVNHDEQQFVASAELLATHSLLPYRDFPYFHTPLLVLAYAGLFKYTTALLLGARLLSVGFAWLSLGVIFWIGYSAFGALAERSRLALALGMSALLLINQTFAYTYFRAWNHAFPVLLMLLATASQWRGARGGQKRWFFASGGLLALAVGSRLSFAPLALPFLIMAWFGAEAGPGPRIKAAGAFGLGLIVGFVPSLIVIAQAPGAFFFDNFAYNGPINAAYRGGNGTLGTAVWGKLVFGMKFLVQPSNLTLLIAFAYLNARRDAAEEWLAYLRRFVLVVLPFAGVGALSATPSYTQYYDPVVALCVVGVVAGLAAVQADRIVFQRGLFLLSIAWIVGCVTAAIDYRSVIYLGEPSVWITKRIHEDALVLRAAVPSGSILTLAPIVVLEAGLDIYPSLATGPFAWRTSGLLSPIQRAAYKFAGPAELAALLERRPPAAILTGYERKLEGLLNDYALKHGYRKMKLPDKRTLWVKKAANPPRSPDPNGKPAG